MAEEPNMDTTLAESKEHIEAAVTTRTWDEHAVNHVLLAMAQHQAVLEELWERFQTLGAFLQGSIRQP